MNSIDRDPTSEIESTAKDISSNKEDINIDINFRIIQQFSTQLYDNPRRAIEELVCNSYDAGAGECYISTPEDSSEKLRVLDNGESMDMKGIEWLWTVAESPKTDPSTGRVAHDRKQIGKFGVGKLAAFALGDRLTYLATKGDTTRVISVDQNYLRDRKASDSPPFPVYEIDREDAEEHFSEYFDGIPNPWEEGWESWTLALVEDISPENTGNQLMPWLLKRMVNSTIPISSRFKVVLNDEQIIETERDAEPIVDISVTDPDVVTEIEDNLKSYWKDTSPEYDSEDDVPESRYDIEVSEFSTPGDIEGKETGIDVPRLGAVMGDAKIYESDLNTRSQEKQGFNEHGFKISVRGKLLNRHDPKWGIDKIGFKWWKKFVSELEIPKLDDALLVQRDSTKRDRREPEIARRVAHSVYVVARRERDRLESVDNDDDRDYEPKSLTHRIGSKTPSQTYEAVSGLSNGKSPVDPESIDITRRTKGSTEFALSYDDSGGDIVINEEHPLYKLLVEQEDIKQNLRDTFGEVYASCLLLLGYLRFNTEEDETLDEAEEFFDYALRSAADSFRPITRYLKSEIETAAVNDDRSLVDEVANAFHQIRFGNVNRAEGNTNRYIRIPLSGSNIQKIQIKSLGQRGKVRIEDDDLSSLEPDEKFTHTFCVCREYGTDEDEREEIVQKTPSNVTLATLEDVYEIIECHYERRFTYGQTVDILHYTGDPSSLSQHIKDVWNETPDKDLIVQILTKSHELQEDPDKPNPSIGGLEMIDGFESYSREEISETVEALSTLTGRVNMTSQSEFYLNSSPENILEELGAIKGLESIDGKNKDLTEFN